MKALIGAAAFGLLAASPVLAEAPPPEAFGRLPAILDAAISSDGTKVVLARTLADGTQAVEVVSAADGSSLHAARLAESFRSNERSTLRGVGWADDTHATFTISATFNTRNVLPSNVLAPGWRRVDYWRVGLVDLERRRHYLVEVGSDAQAWGRMNLAALIAPIEADPGYGRLVARTGPYIGDVLAVYRVDLRSGRGMLRQRGVRDTFNFALDRAGNPAVRLDVNQETNRWRLYDAGESRPRLIAEGASEIGLPLAVAGLLASGGLAGVDKIDDRGREVLFAMDRATGALSTLVEHERYDVRAPIFDPWTHEIVGAEIVENATEQRFIERDLADALTRLKAREPGGIAELVNWSRDRTKFVVYLERASDAGGYYLYQPASERLRRLGLRYPDLGGENLGLTQAITYVARDRTRVPAYLTLPPGNAQGRNLATVVLVHGGPTARDEIGFDWWTSFLASRGYAVIQPNFRGSGGYGVEWERAGYREWGQLMQTDVEDAAAALVRAGIADPARVCIVGASYGGYAALTGAVLTPDRYRCAAAIAGVFDLPMMLADVELRGGDDDTIAADWWRMLVGDRNDDRDHLREISPAYQAQAIKAPVLLIHGANDTVVPIAQSRRMEERMKAAGKLVRLVEFAGEDHWLSDAPTRVQMLRELEAFLAQHLNAP